MAEKELCVLCGGPSEQGHHVTGRGPDGRQLDDAFTVPVCGEDHDLLHNDLRRMGVDHPLKTTSVPEHIERRLQREALFLSRLAEAQPSFPWVATSAGAVMSWANDLCRFVARMDHLMSGWRDVISHD